MDKLKLLVASFHGVAQLDFIGPAVLAVLSGDLHLVVHLVDLALHLFNLSVLELQNLQHFQVLFLVVCFLVPHRLLQKLLKLGLPGS